MEWLPGLLVSASMVMAAYMDVRVRAVADWVWLPGALGALLLFLLHPERWVLLAARMALLGSTGLLLARMGRMGEGDAVALVFLGATPDPRSPLREGLVAAGLAALHLAGLTARGWVGRRLILPMDVFLREQRWIPRRILDGEVRPVSGNVNLARDEVVEFVRARGGSPAGLRVEVEYGVPTAAYLGLGYVASHILYVLGL